MTRAYLRLDPRYDERKEHYPDGPYAALVACFCLGEVQPERGRFRSERFLRALLGRRGKNVPYLIEHGDLVVLPDGRIYIDGWDEWQEGDWKVAERVERIRNRKRAERTGTVDVTVPVTPPITVSDTPDRLAVSGRRSGAVGEGADRLAPFETDDLPEAPLIGWLMKHGCPITPGSKFLRHLSTLVEHPGVEDTIKTFERLAGAGVRNADTSGFVFGAIDLHRPKPDLKALAADDREHREKVAVERGVANTRRYLDSLRDGAA